MKSFFQQIENQWTKASLSKNGAEAYARFQALGLPTVKQEDWKYSSLDFLNQQSFHLAQNPFQPSQEQDISSWKLAEDEIRLVFLNGFFAPNLSQVKEKDLEIKSLRVLQNSSELNSLGALASFENQGLVALNTALFQDGAFLKIPSHWKKKTPIQLIYFQVPTADSLLIQPRNYIEIGAHSEVELTERYISLGENSNLSNIVTEIMLQEGAQMKHYKIQEENLSSSHLYFLATHQARNSSLQTYSISLGAKFARNDIQSFLAEEGSECHLNGLYWTQGSQHVDHNTEIIHQKPHCSSFELYKGVLDENSQGVFNGKIRVEMEASQTVARQLNKNLLLSKEASINSKPVLEILNNDVKCNHGATIGKLDEKQIFYLRSRGISERESKSLLTYAFAADVLESISLSSLKEHLKKILFQSAGGLR